MTLKIALLAASIVVRWTTPGPGSWALVAWGGDSCRRHVEACGYEEGACHVAVRLPRDGQHQFYAVEFRPSGAGERVNNERKGER